MKWFYPLLFFLLSASCKAEVPSTLAERCVQHYAAHYRVPPELIAALIDVESRWNPHALSNKGAMGLMQLMPDTARRYGAVQPFDVEQNIAAGILRRRFFENKIDSVAPDATNNALDRFSVTGLVLSLAATWTRLIARRPEGAEDDGK